MPARMCLSRLDELVQRLRFRVLFLQPVGVDFHDSSPSQEKGIEMDDHGRPVRGQNWIRSWIREEGPGRTRASTTSPETLNLDPKP